MKEYSFVKSFEILEKDIKTAKFTFQKFKASQIMILVGIEELIAEFDEYKIKCSSLLTNILAKSN
jgi:hypothetical protein